MRIAIDCGHNPPSDLGAVSTKHNLAEFIEVHKIVSYCYKMLYNKGFEIVNFAERLKTKVQIVNQSKPDIAIEIHLNACSNSKASGALCLYYPTKISHDLADCILKGIHRISSIGIIGSALIKKRGVFVGNLHLDPSKPIIYFLRKTKCPAVVVEPLFLTNDSDCKMLNGNFPIHEIIAKGIFEGIINWMGLYR